MAVSPGYSDHGVRVVLEALEKASRQQSDDSTEDLVFGNVAKLALDIHQRCRVPKLDPLVAISCDAAYAGIYYAERTLQQKEVEVNPQLLEETQAKLDRLAGIFKEILALRKRIVSRDCLSAAFIWCFGYWETRKIQRLREGLRGMIIHDFWPQGWERPSIRRTIEEVSRAARFEAPNAM